ncbi:MAG: hypothetical protein ACTSSE_12250 [Candidatus Thorarchaeota archaeon]
MRIDPGQLKQQKNLREIQRVLDDKTLPKEISQALHQLWLYVDNQDKLRLTTKKNYMVVARRVLIRANLHPSKWNPELVIRLMESYRRKSDGSEYVAQYRNQVRTVINYILNAHELEDLKDQTRDEKTRVGQIMKMQRIPNPVEVFEDDKFEPILGSVEKVRTMFGNLHHSPNDSSIIHKITYKPTIKRGTI